MTKPSRTPKAKTVVHFNKDGTMWFHKREPCEGYHVTWQWRLKSKLKQKPQSTRA